MLKRKIYSNLVSWKENRSQKKKALIIKGLRQIGKTYIAKQFGAYCYKHVIYINFKNNESAKKVFDGDFVVNQIIMDLTAIVPDAKAVPYETLLIFDEIQECANARASVKVFVEDGRYDVIGTGSLLGIKGYNQKKSKGVPTGSEHIIYMYPLDFEEFLWAKGIGNDIIDYLRACLKSEEPIRPAIHEMMLRYYREYICVGGMPEAVNVFLATSDMNAVYDEQRDILEDYRDDFGKHLDENENEETNPWLLARINEVFDSIPAQLAKENKKFQYSTIRKKGRSADYTEAIQWLVDAGMVARCFNVSAPESPLEGNKKPDCFKLYMCDSGLLMAMLGKGTSAMVLSGDLHTYKGAIYENIVADAFAKKGSSLFYFSIDSGLEIDFLQERGKGVTLIEVKATTGNAKSASEVLKNKTKYPDVRELIKLGNYNIGRVENRLTIPYYLAFLL